MTWRDRALDWLKSLSLLGFGGVIVDYSLKGKLKLLVHPNYELLITGSGYLLVFLGFYYLTRGDWSKPREEELTFRPLETPQKLSLRPLSNQPVMLSVHAPHGGAHAHHAHDHGHDHSHEEHVHLFSSWVSVTLVLVPVLLAIFLTPKPLSSETALSRGLNYDLPELQKIQKVSFHINPESRTLMDWVRMINVDPEPSNYRGQKVKVEGFILKGADLPEHHFLIAKFVISCCVADARPVGLPVRYDPEQLSIPDDQWLALEGEIEEGIFQEKRHAVIRLTSFKIIPSPANPYETF